MPIRIILADDHAVVRDGLRLVLETEPGLKVVGDAADGRAAVRLAKELQPDVAVLDVTMPELNGIDAAMQIRGACPDTEVVILSIHASGEYARRALGAGARGYVLKESAGQEVVEAVRAVHQGRRYLSGRIADVLVDNYLQSGKVAPGGSLLDLLSSREREVLQLVVEGRTSQEIGKTLFLSAKTVESYRSRLMSKLGIKDVPGLVKFAIKHGLTPLE